jgi:hypothetical protein
MCVIYYVINWRNVNDFNDEGDVDMYSRVLCACMYMYDYDMDLNVTITIKII